MAWRQPVKLRKLVAKYNDEIQEIAPYDNPELYSDEKVSLLANPYYNTSWTKSVNSDNTAAYSEMIGMGVGSFDLADWNAVMSNNDTVWVYNPEVGNHIRLEVTKNSNYMFTVKARAYAQVFTLWSSVNATPGYLGQWGPHCSIGFIIDDDTHAGAAYYVYTYSQRYNSSIQTCYRNLWASPISGDTNKSILSALVNAFVNNNEPEPTPPAGDDPYADGGYSEGGIGGGGDFDDTSDIIALPTTPALNLSLNHFLSAYVPDMQTLNDLADWIWGNYNKFDVTKDLAKIFTEPMEAILSLHMLPFTPDSSTAIPVTIGNFPTGLSMKPLTAQFKDIDCGSLTFSEFWGNYLDYNPYTKIVLCLPFVGQVDLDADEVMGNVVSVKYRVDCLTGAFVCFVYIDSDKILGQYSGNCILQVPVTAGSYAAMNAAIAQIAATAAAGFGGAMASAIGGGYGGMIGVEKGLRMGGEALGETLASGASNVNGMKLQISHSGGLTGTAGFLGAMTPYAIIHRPRQSVPEHYNEMAGYPSNVTKTLGDCTGFTSVRTMKYDGLPFTDGEILALDGILKGGVYI